MGFVWGGLTEGPVEFEELHPPADARTHTSAVEVVRFEKTDIGPAVDGGPAVFATQLTEQFTGGLVGTGHADHLRVVQADGSQTVAGVERFVGSVDGRSGSFVLTCYGLGDRPGFARGYWTVVPGSGTGELAGMRGHGSFTVELRDGKWWAEDSFTHWYEK